MARKYRDEQVAYHEAGHAVASFVLGIPVRSAAITDGHPDHAGQVENYPRPAFSRDVVAESRFWWSGVWKKSVPKLMVLYAGQVAEEMYTGRRNRAGASSDDEQ